MKSVMVYVLLCVSIPLCQSRSQGQPMQSFGELLLLNETNPAAAIRGKALAREQRLPLRITLPSGILIEVMGYEGARPVYGVITNLAHPENGGDLAFFDDVQRRYDLAGATLYHGSRSEHAARTPKVQNLTQILLVPDWTADRIMAFDPANGDLLDSVFIPTTNPALQSPKQARLSPRNTITVSDQISDLVQDFTTGGSYIGYFAPAGGVNNAILDNIRGHNYRANGHLIVCVASGTNTNSIAEFDSAGNYTGNFIGNSVGGLNGPFDILFRTSDILITQSSATQGVKQYDLNGAYIGQWAAITNFPQQIHQLPDGRIAVANFSGTGSTGIRLYESNGTFIRLLSGVTGNRGVYLLGNGNFLTTNAAGIHEVDSVAGNLIRTIHTGINLQYIDLVNLSTGQPTFTVTPASMNFDSVVLGSSRTDSVKVKNTGTAALTITSITSSDPRFGVAPATGTLAPSESLFVRVTFTPDSAKNRAGSISFVHNAAGSPSSVPVTGVGKPYCVSISVTPGWNLVSLPVRVENDSVTAVFPTLLNPYVFEFVPGSGYQQRWRLLHGHGYWAKFLSGPTYSICGYPIFMDSVAVTSGWNIVGSISCVVDTSTVTSVPPGNRGSNWFGYAGGYTTVSQIVPGRGYWVKANGSGYFILQCGGN